MRAGLPDVVRRRLDPAQKYGLRLTLVGLAIVLVAVPFATLLFQVLAKGPLTRADASIANRLNAAVHDAPAALWILKTVSWLGRPPLQFVAVGLVCALILRRGKGPRRNRLLTYVVATSAGGGIVDSIVKILVNRPRPQVDHPVATAFGKSFPSGHAMSSTVTYGAILLVLLPLLRGRWRIAAVAGTGLLVLAIGTSRLLLGVHFVSDVVGGYVLGLAWLFGATATFEIWREDIGLRRTEPLAEGVEPVASRDLRHPRAD